jgi:molybdenum cofactor guanylyltransferase/molybdopterin-guanine dinucleotide biosynthesis protein MobB
MQANFGTRTLVMRDGIAGVLLAGGLSRRMGGDDKVLMTLAGRPLIQHAAERLAPQLGALIVNANGDAARFAALKLPVVADETADFSGPLAGVLAALHWFGRARPETRAVVSVSADAPFVPMDLVGRLADALLASRDARAAVAQSRGRRHHVIGLWRMDAAHEIADALQRGERKASAMVDRLGAVAVPFADLDIGGEAVDPFFNVNTPEDLAFAESVLARNGSKPFVVGVAGWKNSGKTTLVAKLVAELARRGYRVSTIKSSHHDITSETDGTDSARHREAGAQEVAIISPRRWAIMRNTNDIAWREEPSPPLAAIVARLAPADIVLIEGMKREPIPKIEVRRAGQGTGAPLTDTDAAVFAVAADHEVEDVGVPVLSLDDVTGLTDALLAVSGRPPSERRS